LISAELYRTSARVVTFGEGAEADVRAENVGLDDQARAHFQLVNGQEKAYVSLAVHGEHFVSNALAVAAVAREVGIPLASVAELLSLARIESKWRMEVTTTPSGITLINDAYNANPESMRAALKSLASMRGEGRTWAVLGEMLELGADSVEEHDAIGRLAVRLDQLQKKYRAEVELTDSQSVVMGVQSCMRKAIEWHRDDDLVKASCLLACEPDVSVHCVYIQKENS
jgi:UDP-N-acetylmuramoyl-tripeptide--D-alanyl-D-alanine ligase